MERLLMDKGIKKKKNQSHQIILALNLLQIFLRFNPTLTIKPGSTPNPKMRRVYQRDCMDEMWDSSGPGNTGLHLQLLVREPFPTQLSGAFVQQGFSKKVSATRCRIFRCLARCVWCNNKTTSDFLSFLFHFHVREDLKVLERVVGKAVPRKMKLGVSFFANVAKHTLNRIPF